MFNPHSKFEVSMITCNEEMKHNAKCKTSRFEPHFGRLRVHLWLDGKRVVDFLLAIIELFSLSLMAAALLSEICRNRRFLKEWVTGVGVQILGRWGRRPQSIYGPLDSGMM